MRKFLEIQKGQQLGVAEANYPKNMTTINLSPVAQMHSTSLYKKQHESNALLFENMNLLKRLEKVESSVKVKSLLKDFDTHMSKKKRISIARDSRVSLINATHRRA